MKQIITTIVILTVLTGALFAQDAQQEAADQTARQPDFYTAQFDAQDTVQGQLGVVKSAVEDGEATTEFFAHALERLALDYPDAGNSASVRRAADEMVQLLAARLGEAQYAAAGPDLWRLQGYLTSPLPRAECLASLGKIQAVDFIPGIVQLLTDYNQEAGDDPLAREQVMYGMITALREYKDSSGYLPVFFTSTGWCSERIKSYAREALPVIMDNPTEPLLSVIRSTGYVYSVKYAALQTLEASQVTAQQKSQGAVVSLGVAWQSSTTQVGQRSILTNTRKLAVDMIRRYGTDDANVYPLLERCYREGVDEQEQIYAIAALSALATDDSARRLSAFLIDINTRLARGTLTPEDERLVRVIIPALGNTGRPLARNALRSVLQADWTGAVQRLAQDALKKIP
ncbi:MAG: hypothetical protein LBN92_03775 [Treponema sp.]|jgi:hypothetical protein|nr:hypothetical protein [Treponema sp.]